VARLYAQESLFVSGIFRFRSERAAAGEKRKLLRRSLLPRGRQSYQWPIDPIDLIQKNAAFMKELQRICAQTLNIGNGCADVLNGVPIFHRIQS